MKFAAFIKNVSPFWLIIFGLVFVLWVPHLLCLGMFMDGIYDALLAENLYKGISTFWAPQTIYYSQPAYWDNPPLAMGTLAVCYKIFGDHYVVERIYSFACAVLQLGLIAILWRTIFCASEKIKSYAWLPCLLWLASPLIAWCYSNNLLENTMSLFTTAALIISIQYVNTQKRMLLKAALTGLILLLALITKGPVALFPLALPVLMIGYSRGFRAWQACLTARQAFTFTLLQVLFFAVLFLLVFLFPGPQNFFRHYFNGRVYNAITHTGADVYHPGRILLDLLLVTSIFVGLALLRFALRRMWSEEKPLNQIALRMLLLGLCASLPIAISAKQSNFYLLPSIVPIAVGFAAYLVPLVQWLEGLIMKFKLTVFLKAIAGCMVVLAIGLCIYNKGDIIRDKDLLNDLKTVNEMLPGETVIRADWSLYSEWSLRAYLLRLYGKKLCMPDEAAPAHFYMTMPDHWGDRLPANAPKIFSGKTFDLYKL